MPQQPRSEYQPGRWDTKPRSQWENSYEKPRDEENCPPNLDYKVIEQIADGVEKMILAWSHGEEREAYAPRSPITDSGVSSSTNTSTNISRGLSKPIKSPLSEQSSQGEPVCSYICPIPIQETPGGIKAEISINGNCPGAGIGSASSQILSQAVKHSGTVSSKDLHADKTVTERATYWYLEASKALNQECGGNSRQAEGKPVNIGRIGVNGWSKVDQDVLSASRSESEDRPENSPKSSEQNASQLRSIRHRHESRRIKKRTETPRSNTNLGAAEQPLASKTSTPHSQPDSETQNCPTAVPAKAKEETLEVASPLAKVNLGRAGGFDTRFGPVTIDDELLEKKLAALTTMPSTPLAGGRKLTKEEERRQCEDLQIALLECAMEYEIKTIELKIKLKSLESTPKHSDSSKSGLGDKDGTHYSKNSRESQIVESMKKQVFKLQREKSAVTKEYLSLQKKERKFEVQKRNLDDAIVRVNRLQRELVKKDQELLDSQLMEKQVQAKLEEVENQTKATIPEQEPAGIEPAKLVSLLPTLREWVKTLKKDQTSEPEMIKLMEGYCLPTQRDNTEPMKPRSANEKLQQSDDANKLFETVVQSLVKEVQALQKELGKLGARNWKHKNQSFPVWRTSMDNRGGKAITGGSPPLKFKRFYNR